MARPGLSESRELWGESKINGDIPIQQKGENFMSLAQALGEGLQVTVIGLIIVFAVLVVIMLFMMAMKWVFYKPDKSAADNKPAEVERPANAQVKETVEDDMDEEELVAVLTAAVAACMNTSTYNLKIKSFRRIENTSPSWNKAGLRDVIDSRF